MSDLNLKPYDPLYPMRVHPYEELLKDQNASVIDKINSIIVYLNSVGKLTSDVVKNWNTVYNWVMNDGLTTGINNKLEDMLAKGEFDTILNTVVTKIGDIATLTTTDKSNLTKAINELVSKIGDLTTLTTPQKDTIVHSINSLQSEVTTNTNAITTNTANIATNTSQLAEITALLPAPNGIDDTANIQNVLNNISNKTLIISHDYIAGTPSSVANTNTILSIVGQSNFKIKGNNGSIKLKNGVGNKIVLVLVDCSNFEIDGLVIDGNKANQTLVTTGNARFLSENCPAILLENAKSFKMKNCTLKNAQGDGIELDVNYINQSNTANRQCEDGEIFGNTIDAVGRNGISLVHTKNIDIHSNTIKNIQLYSTSLASGIDLEVNGTYQFKNENIKLHHNFIRNCAVGIQVLMAGGDDITTNIKIYQNTIDYCGNGVQLYHLVSANGSDVDVVQNYFYKCNNGITVDSSDMGRILHNIIEKSIYINSTSGFGILVGSILIDPNSNLEIKWNKISDCDSNGIYAQKISSSFIVGNDIKNTSLSASVSEKCSIRLLYTCDNIKITHNSINDNSIPFTLTELGGTITNVEISNNNVITTNGTIYWFVLSSTITITKTSNRINGVTQNESTFYSNNTGSITVTANSIFTYYPSISFADNSRSIIVTPNPTTDKLIIKPIIEGGSVRIDFVNLTASDITFTAQLNILVFNNN